MLVVYLGARRLTFYNLSLSFWRYWSYMALLCNTVCRPITDYVGCHTASSGGYWRHFCSDSEAMAQCELFLTAPNRNLLTYNGSDEGEVWW